MKITGIVAFLLLSISAFAQESDIETVSKKACACLDTVSQGFVRTQMYEEIKACVESAITSEQVLSKLLGAYSVLKEQDSIAEVSSQVTGDTTSTPKNINITIVTNLNYDKIEEDLLGNCARMQQLMTTENRQSEVSVSDKKAALELYDEGMDVYRAKDYEKAILKFKKALKKDRN
ncbi:MAG: tetratricopeptide repeat protein, partial [Flavobacteriaceae bacterium]|nr:tetratricopeptide repeat protein [Flavobacteriaceae bacterium]